MTRHLTLACGSAALAAAGLLLTGCSGDELPAPGDGTINPDSTTTVGSYSVMIDWDGCTALDDIQPVVDFMGITGWGSTGLTSAGIPGGLDGEAFNCFGSADLPAYYEGKPSSGTIDVGAVPWDSPEEAAENYSGRVAQLQESNETGGLEFTNVLEGAFLNADDWDESYYHAAETSTGYSLDAIARKGDLILYVFIEHLADFGVLDGGEPVYSFTDPELVDWLLGDYMPNAHADLLALKEQGREAGIAAE
jgi:hypothetical protein